MTAHRNIEPDRVLQESLRRSQEHFRSAFEDAPIGMALVAINGAFLRVNSALCAMLDRSEEELLATDFQSITHPDDLGVDLEHLQGVLDGSIPSYQMEKRYLRRDGSAVWILLSVSVVRDGAGLPEHFLAHIVDVSARIAAETELRRAREAAEAGLRARDAFCSTMSHELRTPLNGVLGLNGLLIESGLDHEQRELADGVRRSGQALLTLVDDILDHTRHAGGDLLLSPTWFDPREVIAAAVARQAERGGERGIEVTSEVEPSLPARIYCDQGLLRRTIELVVDNGIKFTERGSVAVTAQGREEGGICHLTIEVRDTGIGIAHDDMRRLFDPFVQLDASDARRHGGAGLGLAVARGGIEALGGTIVVSSIPGQGSLFTIQLPLPLALTKREEGTIATEGSGRLLYLRPEGPLLTGELAPLVNLGLQIDIARLIDQISAPLLRRYVTVVVDGVDESLSRTLASLRPDLTLLRTPLTGGVLEELRAGWRGADTEASGIDEELHTRFRREQGEDRGEIVTVVRAYRSIVRRGLNRLHARLGRGEMAGLVTLLESMAGGSDWIGAPRMAVICRRLVRGIEGGRPQSELAAELALLDEEVCRVERDLDRLA